jgi:hypothetical protein
VCTLSLVFEQVSSVLRQAIEELEIPVDGAALRLSCELLDRLTAKVTAAIGAFDAAGAWRDTGATSMTAWLRHHTHRSGRESSRLARTARRLRTLPVTAAAYEDGTLSSGQVQAIVANLDDGTTPLFAEVEDEMVARLARLGVGDVSRVMQSWAAAARDHLQPDPGDGDEPDPEPAAEPDRSLHLSETMDGRGELSASLDPEARALAETALRLAETPDAEAEPERTPARRRADAFVDILRFFLDHQTTHAGGRHRPHLNVVVDYEDLIGRPPWATGPTGTAPGPFDRSPRTSTSSGDRPTGTWSRRPEGAGNAFSHAAGTGSGSDGGRDGPAAGGSSSHGAGPWTEGGGTGTPAHESPGDGVPTGTAGEGRAGPRRSRRGVGRLLDGTVLDAATLHRLACDAGIHRVIMAGRSTVLDYGSTTRTAPANLWAAVVARDQHCRFPGCDRPPNWCEAHHVVSWERGGPTAVDNLALLCSRHHHILHTAGWHAELLPDGTLSITDPHGRVHTTQPPGTLDALLPWGRAA